jgi:hypothetical protein
MVVPLSTQPSLSVGRPRVLFEADYLKVSGIPYDVSADGERVLALKPSRGRPAAPFLKLVLNWQSELARLVASR